MDDPVCVESRTGYVNMVSNCPIMWQSKLQSETTISTMEAEIISLGHRLQTFSYYGWSQYHW